MTDEEVKAYVNARWGDVIAYVSKAMAQEFGDIISSNNKRLLDEKLIAQQNEGAARVHVAQNSAGE